MGLVSALIALISGFIIDSISAMGYTYIGIIGSVALESSGLPLPSAQTYISSATGVAPVALVSV